jgi:uncharacterized membrane protein YqjE
MNPAARNRARIAGKVFLSSFACAFAGLALIGFVFCLLIIISNPTFLVGAALGVAACATLGFWWAARPRHALRAPTTPASDGEWPY